MKTLRNLILAVLILFPLTARAELPWQFDQHTRYMALGDSLTAGYGAIPQTEGFVYLLYQNGAFDTAPNTLLTNAGVPAATSQHVLDYQVPQAIEVLQPDVITITAGGDDLLSLLDPSTFPPTQEQVQQVLFTFGSNLASILTQLRTALPGTQIYVGNLYPLPLPGVDPALLDFIVSNFNAIVQTTAGSFGPNVKVADVYSAFVGKEGLLLIERNGAYQFEAHPTNAGHRAIASAFEEAIQ